MSPTDLPTPTGPASDRFSPDRGMTLPFGAGVPGGVAGAGQGGGAPLYAYLGLFMLMLAFFILLNAISHFHQDKVGAVIRSVDQAFAMPLTGRGGAGGEEAGQQAAAASLRDLGDLVRTQLALAKVDAGADGTTLAVILPASDLFVGDTLAIRPDRIALMDRVAATLAPRPQGVQIQAEILFATQGVADSAPLVARAGAMARALVANGVPPAPLSVGLERGTAAGQVRFLFTLPSPVTPVGAGQ